MSQEKQKKDFNKSNLLDNLTDFLGESEGQSTEELIEELKAEGINIDNLISKVEKFVSGKLEESKRGWIKDAHKQRLKELSKLESIHIDVPKNFKELKEKVSQLIANEPQVSQAFFRNFTDLSEEDLRTLYMEFQKLKVMHNNSTSENERSR